MYINVPSSSVADDDDGDDDDDDVPAYAYYVIGFELGLLIAIIILIAVSIFYRIITDRKKKCVSTSCPNCGIRNLSHLCSQTQNIHLIIQ